MSGTTSLISPQAGVCYSFNFYINHTVEHPEKAESTVSGPAYGLEFDVDLESELHLMGGITEEQGVKVRETFRNFQKNLREIEFKVCNTKKANKTPSFGIETRLSSRQQNPKEGKSRGPLGRFRLDINS